MKLVIQIPCYNEERTLPVTFVNLPKKIEGIDKIEVLVIDDGSTDKTVEVAKALGIPHIISWPNNKGLAHAFASGIEECLRLGADIVVNTDGDNQYDGKDVEKLVRPIIEGKADFVVGDRQIDKIKHFSWLKKKLHKIGGSIVRKLANVPVKDVASGFRAYSREAALSINILTEFSHTVESLIQLTHKKIKIISVPIETNPKLRESHLFRSMTAYITSQLSTLLRIYTTYKALRVFTVLGIIVALPGLIGLLRFLYFLVFFGQSGGRIQSLIFSVVFVNIGFLMLTVGLLADLINNNRKMIEKILYRIKKRDYYKK